MDDSAIIELFFDRSEQAIRELDGKYGKLCRSLSCNILHSRQDAEECVNDAYLGVWEAIPPARPDPLPAFLCRIVRNLSLTRHHADRAAKRGGGSCAVALQPPREPKITINWDGVAVNESAGPAPDAAPLYRDPALYNEEILDTQGVRNYYGWELVPAYIPDDLTGGGKAVSGRIVREKATGNVVEDQAGRSFWADFWEDGSPKSDDDIVIPKGFTIRASRLRILRCCLLPTDEERTTDFGGVPVTLSHCSMKHGPFDPAKKPLTVFPICPQGTTTSIQPRSRWMGWSMRSRHRGWSWRKSSRSRRLSSSRTMSGLWWEAHRISPTRAAPCKAPERGQDRQN